MNSIFSVSNRNYLANTERVKFSRWLAILPVLLSDVSKTVLVLGWNTGSGKSQNWSQAQKLTSIECCEEIKCGEYGAGEALSC